MIRSLAKPFRQLAALVLLGIVVAAALAVVVAPVSARLTALSGEIAGKREVLGRLLDTQALKTRAADLTALARKSDIAPLLIGGESDALKAARLQAALEDIAEGQGLRFRSTRTMSPREAAGVRLIAIEASFDATLAQVQQVLTAIRTHTPLLAVMALRMAPSASAALDTEKTGDVLDVRIEVAGPAGLAAETAAKEATP